MKYLFVIDQITFGGITSSMVNIVNELANDGHDIDILTFLPAIRQVELHDKVKVFEVSFPLNILYPSPKRHISNHKYFCATISLACRGITKVFTNKPVLNLAFGIHKRFSGYDVAIAFRHETSKHSQISGCVQMVASRMIEAKRKVAFIHGDYSQLGYTGSFYRRIYNKMDAICCVSEGVEKTFKEALPELSPPIFCVHNCINYSIIDQKKDEFKPDYNKNCINLVSVSRLSDEKAIDRAIEATCFSRENGVNAVLNIIGDGPALPQLVMMVKSKSAEDYVRFYGAQTNPYPYIKEANVLILTSKHEAAPVVFGEASYLRVPIFTTNTSSAFELVGNKGIGWVTEHDQFSINRDLLHVLKSPNDIELKKRTLQSMQIDNSASKTEFYIAMKGE